MNRKDVLEVRPFGHLTVPPERVEVLPNGVTLHSVYGGDQPVSRLSIAFEGGVAEVGSATVANMFVSQMVEGTLSRTADEIADILDYNGARIGVRPQSHHCVLDVWFLNDRAEELMPVIGDCVINANYPESPLETAKLRALSSFMSSREDVAALADEAFTRIMYGDTHPLGQPLTEELITSVSSEQLRAVHQRMMCPKRIHAFLSGCADSRVEQSVREFLQSIPSQGEGYTIDVRPMDVVLNPVERTSWKQDAFQNAIVTGLQAPPRSHEDYIPLRLTVMALGGYFGSRLMANIREEKGLTYGISAYLLGCQEGSYVAVSAQFDCSNTDIVRREIAAEMASMAVEPPVGDELRRLKLHAATSLAEILDTPAGIMGYYANQLFVGTPPGYFECQQDAIHNLTSSKIAEMAAKYLQPDKLSTAIAGR